MLYGSLHGQAAVHTCVAGVCLSPLGSIMWCMFSCSAKDVRSPPDRVCYCLVYSRSSCMQAALPSCRFFIVIAMICSAYTTRCLEIGLMDVRPVGAKSRWFKLPCHMWPLHVCTCTTHDVSLCTTYGMHACLLGVYVCVLVVGSHVCGMWVPWP